MSLAECFELANDEIYTRSQGYLQNRAFEYFRIDNRLARLEQSLKQSTGIEGFSYVGSGDNVVVVRYHAGQAIRFRAPAVEGQPNTGPVPIAPMICPIWKEFLFEGARINFVPYIPNLRASMAAEQISRADAERYIYALMDGCFTCDPQIWFYDYRNFDFKFEQVGLLEDGTPIILDLGSVIYSSDVGERDATRLARDRSLAREMKPTNVAGWDMQWLDGAGCARALRLSRPPAPVLALPDCCGG